MRFTPDSVRNPNTPIHRHALRSRQSHVSRLSLLLWALVLLQPLAALALPENLQSFDVVLGQLRKDLRRPNGTDARGFSAPTALAIDRSHSPNALYVADFQNARILAYRDVSKVGFGSEPDLIIGQDDAFSMQRYRTSARAFAFVSGLTVDRDGTLWVSDTGNGRVLGFRWPFDPAQSQEAATTADVLLGQSSFNLAADKKYYEVACNGGGLFGPPPGVAMDNTFCSPEGLATDSAGNLYVADRQNSRVVIYLAPIATGSRAERVLGQEALNNTAALGPSCNRAQAAPSATTLCRPTHVFISEQTGVKRLYVADTDNNRALIFDDPLNDAAADVVLGQPSLVIGTPGVGAERLRAPQGVSVDAKGALWISDTGNHRLMGFKPPFTSSGGASMIIGQLDAGGNLPNQGITGRIIPAPSATTLSRPRPAIFDESGRMLVPDQDNQRVLIYPKPGHLAAAQLALGQDDLVHGGESRVKARSLAYPTAIAVDRRAGQLPHVYVADFGNSRVLGWYDLGSLVDGKPADLVLGQRSFGDNTCNGGGGAGATTLCWPRSLVVDANGDLWVADTWNHRVLRFPRPYDQTSGEPHEADLVLGQSSLLSGVVNGSATNVLTERGFYTPSGLALGPDGTLWVSDRDNNRVLGFRPPFTTGMGASRLLVGGALTGFNQGGCPGVNNGSYLCAPAGLAVDHAGNLWVADRDNNRVALFDTAPINGSPLVNPTPLAVLGQPSAVANAVNGGAMTPTAKTLRGPEGVSVELRQVGDKLETVAVLVADTANHRVLVYDPVASGYGPAAKSVIGQLGAFDKAGYNTDQVLFEVPDNVVRGVYFPSGVLAVAEGLFIADSGTTMKSTPRGGAVQPAFDGTGNHRVALIRGATFPMPGPDAATPADMTSPAEDMAAPDMATPAPSPDLSSVPVPPMDGGGCVMGRGAALSPFLLAALLIGLGLLRRRRPLG